MGAYKIDNRNILQQSMGDSQRRSVPAILSSRFSPAAVFNELSELERFRLPGIEVLPSSAPAGCQRGAGLRGPRRQLPHWRGCSFAQVIGKEAWIARIGARRAGSRVFSYSRMGFPLTGRLGLFLCCDRLNIDAVMKTDTEHVLAPPERSEA
jgi:hypothetical protein